jgi:hypothetical protein
MSEPRFLPTVAYLSGAMIVWTAAFTAAYGGAAVICARKLGDTAVLGIAALPLWIAAVTLAALAATALIAVVAYLDRSRRGGFVPSVTLLLTLLAVVGIVWNGVPALILTTCA